jgi:Zn-finger nucleic acid-binding protein
MQCPECQIDLQMDKSLKGVLWQCPQCAGVAANLAVLRKLLGREVALNFWREGMSSTPSHRACPSCTQPLHVFACDVDHNQIELDLCKRCQILWFDKGELEAFPMEAMAANDLSPETQKMLAVYDLDLENSTSNRVKTWGLIPGLEEMAYVIIRIIAHMVFRG